MLQFRNLTPRLWHGASKKLAAHAANTSFKFSAFALLSLGVLGLSTAPTQAQSPTASSTSASGAKAPIRLVVPFTPGTGIDIVARQVGPRLAEKLGRPVLVDNKVGASGNIGTEMVVRSPPDGTTLLVTVNTLVMNRSLYPKTSFDPLKDLEPIVLTSWGQLVLVASKPSGIQSAADFIAKAKAQPGKFNYGSPGNGTPHHLAMELVKNQAKIFATHIPYRGTGPALTDLVAGRVQLFTNALAPMQQQVETGRLRALAIAGRTRNAASPNVPTTIEAGFPEVQAATWFALFATGGTPPDRIATLHAALNDTMADPALRARITEGGVDLETSASPADFGRYYMEERTRWGEVVRRAGIVGE